MSDVSAAATDARSVMASEIREQPVTLRRTIERLLPQLGQLRDVLRDCRGITLFARGSSDTAATYGRYLYEIEAAMPCSLGAPSIATLYRTTPDLSGTVAVVLSQSGETDELVEVATWARQCGARTVAITNRAHSPLADAVHLPLITEAGVERAVPATKTHTAQLAALAVLVAGLVDDTAHVAALEEVPDEAARLLKDTSMAQAVADAMTDAEAVVISGRSYTLATAQELALKIQEVCGQPALGLSAADLQHGPHALERPGVPLLITAAPDGPSLLALEAVATTARRRGSAVYGIGGDARIRAVCDIAVPGPVLPEAVAPIVGIVPGQILVETLARRRGLGPDNPHGLTKVTQTAQ